MHTVGTMLILWYPHKMKINTQNKYSTEQAAAALGIRPQTLRASYCRSGSYFGVVPTKLPNRMLRWNAEAIERLLTGEVA